MIATHLRSQSRLVLMSLGAKVQSKERTQTDTSAATCPKVATDSSGINNGVSGP